MLDDCKKLDTCRAQTCSELRNSMREGMNEAPNLEDFNSEIW